MILLRLAVLSLLSRRLTVGLTVIAMALSVALFLGVEKVRTGAKDSFADTISGTDLIIGARSGSVQLLLYSVFRIGNATNNVSWQSYQDIAARPEVAWSVPMSLGDSHRGFRVLGTTTAFFDRYKYRRDRSLELAKGQRFDDLFDAVIGADVAKSLGYEVDQSIVVAHGIASFVHHDDKPFRVSGILEKTGTPVDRTVFVSLEAIEAIHVDWQGGAQSRDPISAEDVRAMDLRPKAITAALIGLESRLQVFGLQRWVNDYAQEPLLAILPGVALAELWEVISVAETALMGVSAMVVVTALMGMVAMVFSGLNERRREMAILRTLGAAPRTIFALLMAEAVFMSLMAVILGVILLYAGLFLARPYVDAQFGLYLDISPLTRDEVILLGWVMVAAILASLAPAIRAYRLSLADGMQIRV
ncbi:FtsX-like permease family protein [Pelagimonas phthalicica]|uniref:FtsX-like permease family protein n=1 Tax=Pelagimonas phthalicica TaxID=1037362 RepID=A0A238JEX7_9RHOB|nr:putative ABC transport system permease protein [Pelagimonas phthalicica]SMX28386.1 FtsX-like permease family protein [Pelagimonas phthalicica]